MEARQNIRRLLGREPRVALGWFIVAIMFVGGFMVSLNALAHRPAVERVEVSQPPIGPDDRYADVALRFEPAAQELPGVEINPQLEGTTCGLYPIRDGLVLVCHA